jgi:hypothetical protein
MSPDTGAAGAPTTPGTGTGTGTAQQYLYCIIASGADVAGLSGLDPQTALRQSEVGPVAVVHSDLHPALRSGAAELSDRQLASLATRHDEVLRSVSARTTVLPVRFATVVRAVNELSEVLADTAESLASQLKALNGCSEWAVHIDLPSDTEQVAAATPIQRDGAATGTDYLLARQSRLSDARTLRRRTAEAGGALDAELRTSGVLAALPLHTAGTRVYNTAYLLPDDRTDAFARVVERHAALVKTQGGQLRVSGPWLPYTFTVLNFAAARDV